MRAVVFNGVHDVSVEEVPDPEIHLPTDAIVRVLATCVCGSDLWYYRGESERKPGSRIGHEFVGVVEEVGSAVSTVAVGDVVIAPFAFSDGTCPNCAFGFPSSCIHGGVWGGRDAEGFRADGGQGELVRAPLADGTLVVVPGGMPSEELLPSLLALSDVMGTGHHAAISAGVRPGATVAVVGDGAVGLSGVIAAKRLGAERIIALSRHADRQALARELGATDVVEQRGPDAIEPVLSLTVGVGVDAVLECVGTGESMATAFAIARPGSRVGYVGVPHGAEVPLQAAFRHNVGLVGGMAPVRAYLPELLEDVLAGTITPGRLFDFRGGLDDIPAGYAAMDERRAIKAMARL
ncbi:IMP dehydrogenase [Cnuibacter physcomitrellae]|uniref:IMP dehydrogenase n=1 Tax=Cnuibacter physcomitrellae TaxID=1619308 RepID=A0A1X9LUH6_9MICO|nr:zinc-dependent alcohol dehydrogenase family protein [Cnuibacter physcomitrellae]ARJ05660.1 IMP dehydrogenase [Cnuibacter physcomitrellae]MCS5496634.1 zinc-dependent alcohol dehydrogenase family protein [Cnuibacter physcomitrellae]GGI36196.1 IMP dehydrogenase [Cnuibacter physcomitrellae]